jgi:hypothetical protein
MTGINDNPLTTRLQAQSSYKFQLDRAPALTYFAQKVNLPRVYYPAPTSPNPYGNIPFGGDHLLFDPFTVEFQVDQNLENWLEIFNWMSGLTSPSGDRKVFTDLSSNQPSIYKRASNLMLYTLDSQKNPVLMFRFENSIPVDLSGLNFDTTIEGTTYITSTVTFRYMRYYPEIP